MVFLHFVFGFATAFMSGIPFGPINLSVVDITLNKSGRHASRFASGAALVEILQATVAILFGKLITRKIESVPEFRLAIVMVFFILGLYFLLKRERPKSALESTSKSSSFVKGIILAVLNPQAMPFWFFVVTYLNTTNVVDLRSWNLVLFLVGVFAGKYLVLNGFVYFSESIKHRLQAIKKYVGKTIGVLLILVGIFEAYKYFY